MLYFFIITLLPFLRFKKKVSMYLSQVRTSINAHEHTKLQQMVMYHISNKLYSTSLTFANIMQNLKF